MHEAGDSWPTQSKVYFQAARIYFACFATPREMPTQTSTPPSTKFIVLHLRRDISIYSNLCISSSNNHLLVAD